MIYKEKKSGKYYGKRSQIGGFILGREYQLCPEGCQLELLTPRPDAVYTIVETDEIAGSNIVDAVMGIDGVYGVRCF